MDTKQKELLDSEKNREYYRKSDSNFMPLEKALYAHRHLDRVDWMRRWVHELNSKTHLAVGCFLAGTKISLHDMSRKNIEDIKIGDYVISAERNKRKVKKIFSRNWEGNIYKINSLCGYSLSATPEHPILMINKDDKLIAENLQYKNINKAQIGDYIAVPVIYGKQRPKDYNKIYLYGWYLAEGHIIYYKKIPKGIGYTLNINEKEEANNLINCAEKLGFETNIRERPNKNTIDISIRSTCFAREIKKLFGSLAENKFIHRHIFTWHDKDKINLLRQLFRGDGYMRRGSNGGIQYTLTTISKRLAYEIKELLNTLYIPSYLYRYERHREGCFDMYLVVIMGNKSNIIEPNSVHYVSKSRIKEIEGYMLYPIQSIFKEFYNGKVYNFEVENDNSYIAEGVGVHNCKDGYECLTLTAEGIECVGIDPSEDAIDEAKLKAREAGLDIVFLVGFGEQIPEGIRVDTISCLEVLEHVIDPDKLMTKLSSIGYFIMASTPDANGRHGIRDSERNKEHIRLYTKKEFEDFMGNYGKIMESVIRDDQICIIIQSSI